MLTDRRPVTEALAHRPGAQAAGIVQRRSSTRADVKAGPLFRFIDDAPYAAALRCGRPSWRAEANLAQTRAQAERYKPLVEANAVSQQEYIFPRPPSRRLRPTSSARAAVQTAQINLGYIGARAHRRAHRLRAGHRRCAGRQGEATQLAVVHQIDPVYVNFTQSVTEVLRLRAMVIAGRQLPSAGRRRWR